MITVQFHSNWLLQGVAFTQFSDTDHNVGIWSDKNMMSRQEYTEYTHYTSVMWRNKEQLFKASTLQNTGMQLLSVI